MFPRLLRSAALLGFVGATACSAMIDAAVEDAAGREGDGGDATTESGGNASPTGQGAGDGSSEGGAPAETTGGGEIATSSHTSGVGGTGGADDQHTSGGGGMVCGEAAPPGEASCPDACTSCGDDGATCVIQCGSGDCKAALVTCPAGLDCEVVCRGNTNCEDAAIHCPEGTRCAVTCSGKDACNGATIMCSATGPCALMCDGSEEAELDSCVDVAMQCGDNACTCEASGAGAAPHLECGDSCDCEACE